uniref:Uncharacterized protein n=1 Tax=Heterosigma akashiwo TaxID=2829 RepID=A0A7S3URS7_HETAK|mmetsp:Transcript_11699/g.18242  ORF Transcript_11699/g.18242 Transcript_11699/m.18242 type:complete len:132 (+) Transcript_11699:212-607(+)
MERTLLRRKLWVKVMRIKPVPRKAKKNAIEAPDKKQKEGKEEQAPANLMKTSVVVVAADDESAGSSSSKKGTGYISSSSLSSAKTNDKKPTIDKEAFLAKFSMELKKPDSNHDDGKTSGSNSNNKKKDGDH